MWKIKEVKKEARGNLKKNYIAFIAVCMVLMILSAEYATSDNIFSSKVSTEIDQTRNEIFGQVISGFDAKGSKVFGEEISKSVEKIKDEKIQNATEGFIAGIADGISKANSVITYIIDTVKTIKDEKPVARIVFSIIGIIVSLLFYMFVQSQLVVGERRFYLENRLYHETRASRVFSSFTSGHIMNIAVTMLCVYVFQLLWIITIVGGPMKFYEYRAVPYILAENPGISRKECFALAREMTYGHKWEMFKTDITFIGWYILGVFTFGILSVLFVNPYYRGTQTEVMATLRQHALDEETEHSACLTDKMMFEIPERLDEKRVADVYPTLKIRSKYELSVPWDRKYSIVHLGLMFLSFAIIGWLWELVYYMVCDGVLINRGSLWGPWLPIYGVGGVLVVILLKPFGKKPLLLAAVTFVLCGIVEYTTSWYFETFKGIKYWDYSNFMFNINGRVCLEGLLMFTILACLGLYIIAPRFDELFKKWPNSVKIPLLIVFGGAFLVDLCYTHFHPHTGEGISTSNADISLVGTDSEGCSAGYGKKE